MNESHVMTPSKPNMPSTSTYAGFGDFLRHFPDFFFDQAPRLPAGLSVAEAEPRLGGSSLTVREQSVQDPTGRERFHVTGLGQPLVIVLEVVIAHLLDRFLQGVGRSSMIAAVTGPPGGEQGEPAGEGRGCGG